MPHVDTVECSRDAWEDVCARHVIKYIDPRSGVNAVLAAMPSVEVLIAEAIHGAVVADAHRMPGIPVISNKRFNYFKWLDWTTSMNVPLRPRYLRPLHANFDQPDNQSIQDGARLEAAAMENLISITEHQPLLSNDSHLENITIRMEEA